MKEIEKIIYLVILALWIMLLIVLLDGIQNCRVGSEYVKYLE